MRAFMLAAGLLILLGVVGPILFFRVTELVPSSPRPNDRGPSNVITKPPRPSKETSSATEVESPDGGVVDANGSVSDPEPASEAVEKKGHYFQGLYLDQMRPLGNQELQLEVVGREPRSIFTRENEGTLVIHLAEDEYPATLYNATRDVLFRFETPPMQPVARLNINLQKPRFGLLIQPVTITAFEEQSRCVVKIIGRTVLEPSPKNRIIVRLMSGTSILAESRKRVDGTDVLGDVEFWRGLPYSGAYRLELAWKPADADPAQVEKVANYLGSPMPAEYKYKTKIFLGRVEEERAQEEKIGDFYMRAYSDCRTARALLYRCAAGLRNYDVAVPNSDIDRLAEHPLNRDVNRLVRGGADKLSLAEWRAFRDEKYPALLRQYGPKAVPFPEKYPELASLLASVIRELIRFAKLESTLLYKHMGKGRDRRDFVDSEFSPEEQWPKTKREINNILKGMAREIRDRNRGRR